MTTIADSSAMLPFVAVFNAAVMWRKASDYDKSRYLEVLGDAVDKALSDLAEMAIRAYVATLPDKPPAQTGDQ